MSLDLQKGVALGSVGVRTTIGAEQDYLYTINGFPANCHNFGYTYNQFIRIWASWKWLQPLGITDPATDTTDLGNDPRVPPNTGPAWPGVTPQGYLQFLDRQVYWARYNGLAVIMTLHEFPRWANGTYGLADSYETSPASRFGKEFNSKPLDDVHWNSPTDYSAWSAIVYYLMQRYNYYNSAVNGGAFIHFFEVSNEPNGIWWPQRSGSTVVSARIAARMMHTARTLQIGLNGQPLLCGPGIDDNRRTDIPDQLTGSLVFLDEYLDELSRLGYSSTSRSAFSTHNYGDVVNDTPTGSTRIGQLRRRLRERGFVGWPYADPARPGVLITEGGARIDAIRRIYPSDDPFQKHAALIQRNHERMYSGADGDGVFLLMNYLFNSDLLFDSGLVDHPSAGGAPRPAYHRWRNLRPTGSSTPLP